MKTRKRVDVVIAGGGWTGLLMAQEIATRTSLEVVVLERGPQRTILDYMSGMDEVDHGLRWKMMQNIADETITHRHSTAKRAVPVRQYGSFLPGTGVGGSGEHWTGFAYRYMPEAFRLKSHFAERYDRKQLPDGLDVRDWGITWDDIEPDYYRVEKLMGVGGVAGNLRGKRNPEGNIFEGERQHDFPLPPHKSTYAMKVAAAGARELGWNPYQPAVATLTAPYENPHGVSRLGCEYCGYCSRYGCMIGAKAQPSNVLLPVLQQQENFELRPNSWVRRVQHQDGQATGVLYMDENGDEVTQPADIVVVAGFTVPNIRMLLLSKVGTPYDPRSGRGTLGRRFTQQTGKVTGGPRIVFPEPLNLFMGAGGLAIKVSDYDRDGASDATGTFLRAGNFGFGAGGATPIRGFNAAPPGTVQRSWGSEWKKANLEHYDRVVSVHGMDAEHMSYRQNFADLDPTYTDKWGDPLLRLTLDFTEHEIRQSQFTAQVLEKYAAAVARAGKAKLVERPFGMPGNGHYAASIYQTTHLQGGATMGVEPDDSVVNTHLQHWDMPNLWVLGASSFPQAGSTNPTLTALAVTYRAADALIDRYLNKPGLVG